MDSVEGFVFGSAIPYQATDLNKRKGTPPSQSTKNAENKTSLAGFSRSQLSKWSSSASKSHVDIPIDQQEEPEYRDTAVGTAFSSEAAVLTPTAQGGMPQGLEAVACDLDRSANRSDQVVKGDSTLNASSRDHQALKGLFAQSSLSKKIVVERKKAAELAQHAVGNARSPSHRNALEISIPNDAPDDIFAARPRHTTQPDTNCVVHPRASIDDVIPDSLKVLAHAHPQDIVHDIPQHACTESTARVASSREQAHEERSLELHSNNSSPGQIQPFLREHQTDEKRVELLTQVGRKACDEQGEQLLHTSPTQDDIASKPAHPQAIFTHCKSKSAVNPEVLRNLGAKRSRPRPQEKPAAPSEFPVAESNAHADPIACPLEAIPSAPDVENALEGFPAPAVDDESPASPQPLPEHRAHNPIHNSVFAVDSVQSTPSPQKRSSIATRRSEMLDKFGRPFLQGSPLGRRNESTSASRHVNALSPINLRARSTGKTSEGQDDMYIAFGLMIKAKEREQMLEEKSQTCHRLEADLKKLRYELAGTQKALGIQANILSRARAEDSKRVREQKTRCQHLELQVSRYKKQIEATSKISADYQRRYLLEIDEAKHHVQQEYESKLRIGLTDAEAELKIRFQNELEAKDKEIREVTGCINQSKTEAMLRTEDLMRLREELQDVTRIRIEKEVDQQDLCYRNDKLAADLTKASGDLDNLRSKMETLADERSRLLGQLDCLEKQLAARDLSLGELQQLQTKSEELQTQLAGTVTAFELQSTALAQREKDYHELFANHKSLMDKEAAQAVTITSLETQVGDITQQRDAALVSQAKLEHEVKTACGQMDQSRARERELQQQIADLNQEKQNLTSSLTRATTEVNDLKAQQKRLEEELSNSKSKLDAFMKDLSSKTDQSRETLAALSAKIEDEMKERLKTSKAEIEKLSKRNGELVQRFQDMEKANVVAETKLQYEVSRLAELQQTLLIAQNDLLARDKQLANNVAQIKKAEGRLQSETAKLERSDDRRRQLEETVRQLQADVQARIRQDEGLIARYQDDNLRPMELSLIQLAVNETVNELVSKHKEEISKRETTLQSQLAQIAELKKDNAQKQAQLRTANQNLAQATTANKTGRTLIPSDGWEQSSETGGNSSRREAEPEILGQDKDADDEDELSGSQTIVGTQPARPTQMPRRLRVVANPPSAGQRLAKETVFNAAAVVEQTRFVAFEQESESMKTEAIGTFASITTQRPKFSSLARNDPDSSPTARRIVRLPEQVDELDQAPSQDPIESSDDEGGEAEGMLTRSISIAPIVTSIGLSKTRGQKRQAESMEAPMNHTHMQLSRQESVPSTQDVYAKPVTKRNAVGYGKKAKRDRK